MANTAMYNGKFIYQLTSASALKDNDLFAISSTDNLTRSVSLKQIKDSVNINFYNKDEMDSLLDVIRQQVKDGFDNTFGLGNSVSEFRNEFNSQLHQLDTTLRQEINEVDKKFTDIINEYKDEMSDTVININNKIDQNKTDINNRVTEVENNFDYKLDQLDIKLSKQILDLDTKLSTQITSLDSKLTKNINDLDTKLSKNISDLNTELSQDIIELGSNLNDDISDLDTELSADIAALNKKIQDLTDLDFGGDISDLDSNLSKQISDLDTKVSKQISDLNTEINKTINNMNTTLTNRIDGIDSTLTAHLEEMNNMNDDIIESSAELTLAINNLRTEVNEKTDELSDRIDNVPNLHLWKRYSSTVTKYTEQQVTNVSISATAVAATKTVTVYYADKVNIVDGKFSNTNFTSTTIAVSKLDELKNTIKGKYVRSGVVEDYYNYYKIPTDVVLTEIYNGSDLIGIRADKASWLKLDYSSMQFVDYASSLNKNTYPTDGSHTDGYSYKYFKQLGDDLGTAITYGTSVPTSLATGEVYLQYF